MLINLREYATELEYWLDAFGPFIASESLPALRNLQRELEDGRDNYRPRFDWKLPHPILTNVADRYDGPDRSPHGIRLGWQFTSSFSATADSRRRHIWSVDSMVTHIKVYSAEDNSEILHFHVDLKNRDQLGPHVHMQLSEHYLKDKGRIPLAIPRFPSAALLPTDCFDLVLCEVFPFSWPRSQSGSRGLATLRQGQQCRFVAMSQALVQEWRKSPRKTPIAALQNCGFPDILLA